MRKYGSLQREDRQQTNKGFHGDTKQQGTPIRVEKEYMQGHAKRTKPAVWSSRGAHVNPEAEGAHVNPEAEGAHVNPEAEGAHAHLRQQ